MTSNTLFSRDRHALFNSSQSVWLHVIGHTVPSQPAKMKHDRQAFVPRKLDLDSDISQFQPLKAARGKMVSRQRTCRHSICRPAARIVRPAHAAIPSKALHQKSNAPRLENLLSALGRSSSPRRKELAASAAGQVRPRWVIQSIRYC